MGAELLNHCAFLSTRCGRERRSLPWDRGHHLQERLDLEWREEEGAPCPTWQLRNRQTQNGNSMMPTPNCLISRAISKAILEGDAGSHRACFDSCLIVAGVSNGLDSVIRGRIPLMTNHHRSLFLHCFTASAKGQINPLTGLSSSGTSLP